MNWKLLTFILVVVIFVCFLHNYSFCVYNTKPTYELVIHDNFNVNWLKETIKVVYKLISPIAEQLKTILPITNRISHWMLGFKLSNGKVIVCSSSPYGYIELYSIDEIAPTCFKRTDKDWVAIICGIYTNIKQYTLTEFVNVYMKYYISFNRYWFFDDNCQKMTSYALHNIFEINDDKTIREPYDMSVIPEYFKAMKNKWFGRC